jgi:hypothetical protein
MHSFIKQGYIVFISLLIFCSYKTKGIKWFNSLHRNRHFNRVQNPKKLCSIIGMSKRDGTLSTEIVTTMHFNFYFGILSRKIMITPRLWEQHNLKSKTFEN